MIAALDTSVLVAGLVVPHPHHARALWWLQSAGRGEITALASWHAIAETFAVLTRLPIRPRISATAARRAVDRLARTLDLVAPTAELYRQAVERCADRQLTSGAVFDALHLVTAERRDADALLTFNQPDFERLTTPASPRIVIPPDPPGLATPDD